MCRPQTIFTMRSGSCLPFPRELAIVGRSNTPENILAQFRDLLVIILNNSHNRYGIVAVWFRYPCPPTKYKDFSAL